MLQKFPPSKIQPSLSIPNGFIRTFTSPNKTLRANAVVPKCWTVFSASLRWKILTIFFKPARKTQSVTCDKVNCISAGTTPKPPSAGTVSLTGVLLYYKRYQEPLRATTTYLVEGQLSAQSGRGWRLSAS